jgi:TonB family protein
MFCNNCGNQVQDFNKFCPKCGMPMTAETPTPPSSQPFSSQPNPPPYQPASSFGDAPRQPFNGGSMGQPQKRSGGCGKVLLVLSIVLLLLGGGIAAALYYGYHYAQKAIKSSEAYTVALAALKNSPQVAAKMGEIKDTGFPLGSFSEDANGTGAAAYAMSVEGTKASGNYKVVMRRQSSKWHLIKGSVTLNDGETIDVVTAEESILGGDDNENSSGSNSNTRPPAPPTPGNISVPKDAINGGVLNSKAVDLPKPAYPPVAKAVHASGSVAVHVVVDEDGSVMAAKATSGHPLLRQAAEAAAMKAQFTPTMLSGHPVKLTGIIMYNFEAQ